MELDLKNDLIQFEIKYKPEIEEKFKTTTPTYLFHGSGTGNWHSILRNGLKNCSGTGMQLNGAAHGPGIYLSSASNLSIGYSRGNMMILGICQMLGDIQKYHKGGTIYVVPDEDVVLLRYLLVGGANSYNIAGVIDKYFNKELIVNKSIINQKLSQIGLKRLIKEYKIIQQNKPPFELIIPEDNTSKWIIKFPDLEIELTMIFEEGYPMEPPFCYVSYPILRPGKGWLTDGGSFCLDMLTPQKWKPVYSLEMLIMQLRQMIIDDQPMVLEHKQNTYESAKNSFFNIVETMNW